MHLSRVGVAVFAAALVGLGVLGLIHGDFALVWQPVPDWVFTLLTWLPGVVATPGNRMEWTGLCVSWLLTGGSWVVAGTYRGVPWFAARPLARRAYGAKPL